MSEKLSVLIVDDEINIGLLIRKLIHWEELNLECMDVVDNGEDAREIIRYRQPNIVISDISMPVVGGLDLAQIIKEEMLNTYVILVSGYQDFQYAIKAMKMGVEHYLLKLIKEDELNESLKQVIEKYTSNTEGIKKENELKKSLEVSKELLRRNTLERIINEDNKTHYYLELIEGERKICIDIKLDYFSFELMTEGEQSYNSSVEAKTEEILQECMHLVIKDMIICPTKYNHIFCLIGFQEKMSCEIMKMISRVLLQLKDNLRKFNIQEVTIGISNEVENKQSVSDADLVNEARSAVNNRIKLNTGRLIRYANIDKCMLSRKNIELLIEAQRKKLQTAFEYFTVQEIESAVDEIFEKLEGMSDLNADVYFEMIRTLREIIDSITGRKMENKNELRGRYFGILYNCRSILEMKRSIRRLVIQEFNEIQKELLDQYAKPVRIVKEYIDKNYGEHITLESLAELVDLNPIYFSTVFKKETGMNISTYIQIIRIEEAKKLLLHTSKTVSEISNLVGYTDPKYFSKVFQKASGMKPITYRRIHS